VPVVLLVVLSGKISQPSLMVLTALLWGCGLIVYVTSQYLYEREVNIERVGGRFAGLKRMFFRLVKSVPWLGKRRRPFKALRGVSFEIKTGMFGLLGPNGAGKSTLMRIVTGILEQSYGCIRVNGLDTRVYREELQGLIGFLDDFEKISKQRSLGLRAWQKIVGQALIGIGFSVAALHFADRNGLTPASTRISFARDSAINLAFAGSVIGLILFILWANFLITAWSNAVNLTDGLDGLAIMPVVLVAGGLSVFAYISGSPNYASYLHQPVLPGVGEMAVFCAAIAGAGLGFLWYNAHPALVFMGDVGALSLGAALATIAVAIRQELVFALMGGIFVAEALSVMIQVISYKTRGKRVFRMAPLHHHFELGGWTEVNVVIRFWIIAGLCVIAGLGLFYAEYLRQLIFG